MVKAPRLIWIALTFLVARLFASPIAYSAQSFELKPEKNPLEVAIAATGPAPSAWPTRTQTWRRTPSWPTW